jgi:hypothetical protein
MSHYYEKKRQQRLAMQRAQQAAAPQGTPPDDAVVLSSKPSSAETERVVKEMVALEVLARAERRKKNAPRNGAEKHQVRRQHAVEQGPSSWRQPDATHAERTKKPGAPRSRRVRVMGELELAFAQKSSRLSSLPGLAPSAMADAVHRLGSQVGSSFQKQELDRIFQVVEGRQQGGAAAVRGCRCEAGSLV